MIAEDGIELSIVIVSWNVADLLESCLHSIENNSSEVSNLEAIVVDNASSDNTVERIERSFPWVRLIANRENRGFASANNQALSIVQGKYIMLLNPDTVVSPGCFHKLIGYMERNPWCGMAGPRLVHPDGTTQLTCARRLPTLVSELFLATLPGGRVPFIGPYLRHRLAYPYDYRVTQEVEAVSGAVMLIRRSTLLDVGPLDGHFFHCGEDIEWCHRVREAGWQVVYVHDAKVAHYFGQSSIQNLEYTFVNATLSIQYYFHQSFGLLHAAIYKLFMRVIGAPWLIIASLLRITVGQLSWAQFQQRVRIAKGLLKWRYVDAAATRNVMGPQSAKSHLMMEQQEGNPS